MLQWIMNIVHEEPATDYDRFIQDGSILSKVMTSIVFNSVALDQIDDNWGVVSFGTGHPPSEYHLLSLSRTPLWTESKLSSERSAVTESWTSLNLKI